MTPIDSDSTELRSVCPFCDSLTQSGRQDPKFYVNLTTGLYWCFHCQAKGKDLTDEQLENLDVIDEIIKKPFDKASLSKLVDKHIILEDFIAERFPDSSLTQDGTLVFSNENQAIALLTRNFSNEIVGIKYRHLDPNALSRYTSEPGSVTEGHWTAGKDKNKLLILEGELDALTAKLAGFEGFILACQRNRISESQLKAIRGFRSVFILPDNDLGGEELENSAMELLGALKPIVIKLSNPFYGDLKDEGLFGPSGVKDLNEVLTKGGMDVCREFIRLSTQTELERDTRDLNSSIPELCAFLSNRRNTRGDSTGWKSIDELLGGGLRPNEMSVINAFAKTGKTSFINNLVHNLTLTGKRVALASFEMDPARSLYPSLLSIASGLNIRELPVEELEESVKLLSSEYQYLQNLVTLKRFGYTPWQEIEDWARHCKSRYAIEYLVLDHAGFMVEKMTDAEENQVLAKNIKKLTNTLDIHIPVVVQAPKTKDGLSIQTAYGGLAWGMNADNFIILERSKDNDYELKVKLEASRYPGANPSSTPALLFYDKSNCSLTE